MPFGQIQSLGRSTGLSRPPFAARSSARDLVTMMRRVLIVQDSFSGHRLSYVERLTVGALEQGLSPTILVRPEAPNSREWNVHLAGSVGRAQVESADNFSISGVRQRADELAAEVILIPDGDNFLPRLLKPEIVSWARRRRLVVLVMRPDGQAASRTLRTLETWSKALLRTLVRMTTRARVLELVSATAPSTRRNEVRDPASFQSVVNRAVARQTLGLDPDRYWFGVVGAISERKNLPLVVRALSLAKLSRPVGLVVAGRLADGLRSEIASLSEMLREVDVEFRVRDEVMDDASFDAAVGAIDCVVLAHSNEGPSGLLAKASIAGIRVVAAGAKSLQRDLKDSPIGEWVPLALDDLSGAAERAVAAGPVMATRRLEGGEFARAFLREGRR